jgi:hypothetical protein
VTELPENVWRDDQVLLGGLVIVRDSLSAYLENIVAVTGGTAPPLPARLSPDWALPWSRPATL